MKRTILLLTLFLIALTGEVRSVDFDKDNIPDSEDNCPRNYNPYQADIDIDGIGDICDGCPFHSDTNQINSTYTFLSVSPGNKYSNDSIITVDDDCPADFSTIQTAIDAAVDGSMIIVAPGSYVENISFEGRNIILSSIDPNNSTIVSNTIIDGNSNGSVVTFTGTEGPDCLLTGFTITNGNAVESGGGICGRSAHAVISRCIISGNGAPEGKGGGIYQLNGIITNCNIEDNIARYGGGLANCNGVITHSFIVNNKAASTDLVNLSIGGGLYLCNGYVTNCTILGNLVLNSRHDGFGGGIADCNGPISNCIIWDNYAPFDPQIFFSPDLTYNCIQSWTDNTENTGNIACDPCFAEAGYWDLNGTPEDIYDDIWIDGDYHLKSQAGRWDSNGHIWIQDKMTSPCIDAGDPSSDYSKELSPHGNRINIGAYGNTNQASLSPYAVNIVGKTQQISHKSGRLMAYRHDGQYSDNGQINPADEAVFTFTLNQTVLELPENTDTADRISVAEIEVNGEALVTYNLSLSGDDASLFEIDPAFVVGSGFSILYLKAGAVLDFETNPVLDVTINIDDPDPEFSPDKMADLSVTITNFNEPPAVTLINTITALPENTDTTNPIKVADIIVSDDGLGTNILSLSGADASLFHIEGTGLFLNAGVTLELQPDIEVYLSDPSCAAYWRFEQGALGIDSIGNNNLRVYGPSVNTNDFIEGGASAEFSGDSERLMCLDSELDPGFPLKSDGINKDVTTIQWIKFTELGPTINIFWAKYKYRNIVYRLLAAADGRIRISTGYEGEFASQEHDWYETPVQTGRWYFIASTYRHTDRSYRVRIYDYTAGDFLDDDLTGNFNRDIDVGSPGDGFFILSYASPVYSFRGLMDACIVFDRVLSVQELEDIRLGMLGEGQGNGSLEVTVQVDDAAIAGTPDDAASLSITITTDEANTTPVLAAIGDKTVDEGNLLSFTAVATDSDIPANVMTFSLIDAPSGASIDPVSGVFTWTPGEEQGQASYLVTIRVTDDGTPNLYDRETITITVNEVNTAPVLVSIGDKAVDEGSLLTFTAVASDSDIPANVLTFSLIDAPTGAAIDPVSGIFTWTPDEGQGSDTYLVTIRVTDNSTPNLYEQETITITVNETNVAPLLEPIGDKTVEEGDLLSFTAVATDSDIPANVLTFSLIDAPSGATIDPVSGVFTWTPGEEQGPASYLVTIRVTDDGTPNLYDQETITITVTEPSEDPVIAANTGITVIEGGTGTIDNTKLQVTDVDNSPAELQFTLTSVPANGLLKLGGTILSVGGTFSQVDIDSNLLTYEHNGGETVSDSFQFTVSDGSGGSIGNTTFIITVTPVNDEPVLVTNAGITVIEGGTEIIGNTVLQVTDIDNTPAELQFTLTAVPLNGLLKLDVTTLSIGGVFTQADIDSNLLTYEHDGGETVSDSFQFTVSDGSGGSIGNTTFNITITPPNQAPTAEDDTAEVDEDTSVIINVLANDSDGDGDALSVESMTQPTHGTATLNLDDTITYEPEANFNGTDSFTYTISDSNGGTDTAAVSITIRSINDAPVADAGDDQVLIDNNYDGTEEVNLNGSGSNDPNDPDGTIVSYVWTEAGTEIATGATTTVPLAIGEHTITLTVTDDEGGTDSDDIVITVKQIQLIIDHTCRDLTKIPLSAIERAKDTLHIEYGHTSHGFQITAGIIDLVDFINNGGLGLNYPTDTFAFNDGGADGALDLPVRPVFWDYGAFDLGRPDRYAWAAATRDYLDTHSEVNVIMWSWCGQANTSIENIDIYLNLMEGLIADYPDVRFVFMTGHLQGQGIDGGPLHQANEHIRNHCRENNRILYDFADIESYDPDGLVNYMPMLADVDCAYDSDGDGTLDRNWALDWQNSHIEGVDWYECPSFPTGVPTHTQSLNCNLKAYAAWWLWATLAGWDQTENSADFIVTETEGNTWVSEAGSTDIFQVVLSVKPASGVVINVAVSDAGEATVDSTSLIFTPDYWDIPQTITVIGVDDDIIDGDQTTIITLSVDDDQSDDQFDGAFDKIISVTTTDNDMPGFTVIESDGFTQVSELGTTDAFRVVLDTDPASDVVININVSDTTEATIDLSSLTFTQANWNVPQTVTVTGQYDDLIDGDQTTIITLSVDDAQSDDQFDGVLDQTINVITKDTTVPINNDPVLWFNTGLVVLEGGVGLIDNTILQVTDIDNIPSELQFTLTSVPLNGLLKLDGTTLSIGGTFTQADIDSNLLTYEHDGGETVSDSFQFTVSDGSGGSIGNTTFDITITNVNEPPTVTLINTITALPENADTTNPIKVADIVVTDDGLGTNILSLSGADASLFHIEGTELFLNAGVTLERQPDIGVYLNDSSCAAYWRFEQGAIGIDSVGNNNLRVYGPSVNTNDFIEGGASAEFSGSSERLMCLDNELDPGFPMKSDGINKDITTIQWIKFTELGPTINEFWAKYKYRNVVYRLSAYSDGRIRISSGYEGEFANQEGDWFGTAVQTGRWYFIASTYRHTDRSYRVRIYDYTAGDFLDDDLTGNFNRDIDVGDIGDGFFILSYASPTFSFKGLMDACIVFDRALSVQELEDIRLGMLGEGQGNGTLEVTVQVDDAAIVGTPDDTASLSISITAP